MQVNRYEMLCGVAFFLLYFGEVEGKFKEEVDMVAEDTIEKAYQSHYRDNFNVTHVEVQAGYIVVLRSCENCVFYRTEKTKHCFSPSSEGCWQFKYNKQLEVRS